MRTAHVILLALGGLLLLVPATATADDWDVRVYVDDRYPPYPGTWNHCDPWNGYGYYYAPTYRPSYGHYEYVPAYRATYGYYDGYGTYHYYRSNYYYSPGYGSYYDYPSYGHHRRGHPGRP